MLLLHRSGQELIQIIKTQMNFSRWNNYLYIAEKEMWMKLDVMIQKA